MQDPLATPQRAGSSPVVGSPVPKRVASSPLEKDSRNVKPRQGDHDADPQPGNSNATNDDHVQVEENTSHQQPLSANDNTANSAINNQFFPSFKLLRKLNNKLVTAKHHKTFLITLKENGQVPKGLQVKSAPTGAELDLYLYHQWEEAHIELSNKLRDILIKHWITTEANLSNQITDITENLRSKAPPDQVSLIFNLIDKANSSKAEELATRRRRKRENPRIGISAAGAAPPNTNVQM